MYFVERYHDISVGHRVVGHEHKCRFLHGHNYRIHFVCTSKKLDTVGRVIDFSVIKELLCLWLENHWDHRFLLWDEDPITTILLDTHQIVIQSIVVVPFNPTAENMAQYLVEKIGPIMLEGTGVVLHQVRIEETRKCSATYTRNV